jgi:hypothetical protein
MTLTWDISFLLDIQGKIEEARGNCLEILGEPARAMVGRSFLPFITGADRAHFRRFLGQLGNANAVRRALLHLRTSLRGDSPFFMEAQGGWSPARFWILLAVPGDQGGANPLAALEAPIPATSDDDLLMLIELTAEQAAPLDLTVFAVGGLAAPTAADAPDTSFAGELRRQVEKSLLTNAYDGVVSQSAPGIYNVLHDAETSPEKIAGEVQAGAREIGISEGLLGLTHRTVKLGIRPDRERIKAAMAAVRAPIKAPIQDRSLPPGIVATKPAARPRWLYLVLGAVGLFVLGAVVAMLLAR